MLNRRRFLTTSLGISGLSCFPALAALNANAPRPPGGPPVKLAVLLVFDQLRGDYLVRWRDLFGDDGFKRLLQNGAWFPNCHYPYAGTWTAAGHATLASGRPPREHGIIANEWYDRDRGKEVTAVGDDRYEQIPPTRARDKGGASPSYRLEPTLDDGTLFFVIRDRTSGKTTYGASRFLYTEPAKDGIVYLDFNQAENPPCAFTPLTVSKS